LVDAALWTVTKVLLEGVLLVVVVLFLFLGDVRSSLIVAQHYNLDTGQVTRIRNYLAQTQPAQIPLAEKRAAERIREIDARRD
jgi:hypothetical protein